MKVLRFFLILALAVSALGFFPKAASAGAFTYTSGIQVQNLENTDAGVTITFYKKDGSIEKTLTDTIIKNSSKTYYPLNVSDGFDGSVVISSDKQVAAVANVVGNNFAANASYVASTAGSTTVLLPLLQKNNGGFFTWFNVQNTNTTPGADATVNIAYSDGTTASATVKPGAAHTFDQALEPHSLKYFSAVVTSNQPVAVTVIEETSTIMYAYSGFIAGSTNPVMPLINVQPSKRIQTGIAIQNSGDQDTVVEVSYTPTPGFGTACKETQTIAKKTMAVFALFAFANGANSNCIPGSLFVGSAKVTSNSTNQPLVAVVNQLTDPGVNGEAYGAFDPAQATSKVVLPLIMDRNSTYFTGFNIMNAGTSNTTVTCTFTGTTYTISQTLTPGQALNDIQNGKIKSGYVGSATCTASGGADNKIVAVVNELSTAKAGDQLMVYEGINVSGP